MDNLTNLENCDEIHKKPLEPLVELLQPIGRGNQYELDGDTKTKTELNSNSFKIENNNSEINSNKLVIISKDCELTDEKKYLTERDVLSTNEYKFGVQSLSADPIKSELFRTGEKHIIEIMDNNCLQTCQESNDSTITLQVGNLDILSNNLNAIDVPSGETEFLNKPNCSSADDSPSNIHQLLPFSDCSNFENVICPSSSNHEAVQSTSQCVLYERLQINPNPNEFDMVEENCSGYSTFVIDENNSAVATLSNQDNSVVISNNNALPRIENMVSSNYSLAQLRGYGSDDSLNEESSAIVTQQYRDANSETEESDKESDSDSSSTSSSTSIIVSDSDSSESESDEYENVSPQICKPIKGKCELELQDLPPIEDLKISVPEEDCVPIGKVFQIVDQLVVIQALKDMPAYDLDTVLFLQGGQPLGKIFDVFGRVTEPYYCVRFNSRDHIAEKNISLNQIVYCAPKTKHTNYVFLTQLMKLKGSDASWIDDDEPPEIYLEYSDDEQEQKAKKKKNFKNRKAVLNSQTDPDEPARKKHFAYEKKMNERNLQLSAFRNHQNLSRNRAQSWKNVVWARDMSFPGSSTSKIIKPPMFQNVCHQMFGRPPSMFNNVVPPANKPFTQLLRPNMPNITSPGQAPHSLTQCPPQRFINPNSSLYFPRPLPHHRPRLHNNPGGQPFSFLQTQMPGSSRLTDNQGSNGNPPNRVQSLPRFENPWASPPPRYSTVGTNKNLLPSSPFWIERHPSSFTSNTPVTFPAFPNRPYLPPCPPPPQPFWASQSPSQTRNVPLNNSSQVNFNAHVPSPPSPNPYTY